MSDLTAEAINTILEIADHNPKYVEADGTPFICLPAGTKIESLDAFVKPKHIRANPSFNDVSSFTAYVLKFADDDTIVFANPSADGVEVAAIIDYHHGVTPEWCKHKATFKTQLTPEYQTWMAANRKQMNQVDFATWLEDNANLMVEPSGTDLLELVRTLHGHKNARFSGEVRLATGNYSVSWEEETVVKATTKTEGGSIELPRIITAGIAPFLGASPYAIQARLKTKVEERKLALWFETIAPHVIIRDSINLVCAQIKAALNRPLLIGAP